MVQNHFFEPQRIWWLNHFVEGLGNVQIIQSYQDFDHNYTAQSQHVQLI